VLQCDCGFEVRAEDEGELIAQVQRHAVEAHGMALTTEQALLLAFRAQLGTDSVLSPGRNPDGRRSGRYQLRRSDEAQP
jgi:hypothetical protein